MATLILRIADGAELLAGSLGDDRVVYQHRPSGDRALGRVDEDLRVFRTTTHGEHEVGLALHTGAIHSAGLIEGGPLGWMEPDGVVVRGGLILGEEDVGRVEGPHALAAAAALLLLLLPIEEEEARLARR